MKHKNKAADYRHLSRRQLVELLLTQREQQTDSPESVVTEQQLRQLAERLDRRRSFWQLLRSTVGTLITVAAISVLITMLFTPVLRISGQSMTPTLTEGEVVVCLKGHHFAQGDLIAFYYGNKLLVKRCIAGPGDWVDIDEDGSVYVNDVYLEEPWVDVKALGETDLVYPYQVPDDKYFVLGDHRSISMDSRLSQMGCISTDQISGRIILRIWPLKEFGFLTATKK